MRYINSLLLYLLYLPMTAQSVLADSLAKARFLLYVILTLLSSYFNAEDDMNTNSLQKLTH